MQVMDRMIRYLRGKMGWMSTTETGDRTPREKAAMSSTPAGEMALEMDLLHEISESLRGAGDDPLDFSELLNDIRREGKCVSKHDVLARLLQRHPRPHVVNYLLSCEEKNRRADTLSCYPPHVWMDLTSFCNVECRFCKSTFALLPRESLSLKQIQAVEWFRFVRWLNLSAGTGESMANPEFIPIFDHIRDTYPHLHISVLTNGKTLNEPIVRCLAGRLDALHISMNASNREDYNRVIKHGNWDAFSANLKAVKTAVRASSRPKVSASFVMMRWNLDHALGNLEFAVAHGASLVLFHHYYTPYIQDIHRADPQVLAEKFPTSESLYRDRARADDILGRVAARAKELGVQVQVPPPFHQKCAISFGVRSVAPAADECLTPWQNMYLLWGIKSKRPEITICCGLASDIGVHFQWDNIVTCAGLRAVWNNATMQAYRRTANAPNLNPICRLCRILDRFDPELAYPDQKSFFQDVGLPVPEHLR